MNKFWLFFGFFGQFMFFLRFLWQWIVSEKKRRSIIPIEFWFLSIAGSTILLSYAIYRRDPVFTLGQTMGIFIYIRNLILIRKEKKLNEKLI
jgi:lipid-A-disaccharide synthase-like uncharacterized protein